ncbi:MAG: hypothetical protein OXC91_00820 [Rhodobacteraceae bacterium]|nr:hypothetical protein [Paracoccaceae bacterium]
MKQIDELISLIEQAADLRGVRNMTICNQYLSDPHLYDRLKSGSKKVTVDKLERSLELMSGLVYRLKKLQAQELAARAEAESNDSTV